MISCIFSFFFALSLILPLMAESSTSSSMPPFIQVGAKPNIILILDNSNSMDEDFYGNAVGSFSPASKSVVAKKALRNIIDQYKTKLRVGLMAYKIKSPSEYHLHNSAYFASYDPKSYCPNPPPECQEYCANDSNTGARDACNTACRASNPLFDATYRDETITAYANNSEQRTRYCSIVYPKTQRVVNPTDINNFIFFKMALPYYNAADQGTEFDYSTAYNPLEGAPYSSYNIYRTKTGTDDGNVGYSNGAGSATYVPTDSDFALGFYDFGRRMFSTHTGRTWFVNSSPNPAEGFRYVDVGELSVSGTTTSTFARIWEKLDPKENDETGYMSCKTQSNSSTDHCHIVNAGLTPTSGTIKSVIDYVKGSSTPIQGNCNKTFVIYVTDGLPSVNETGATDTAANLMPQVLSRIGELRNISVGGRTHDIQTYVLGVGLSAQAKVKLDDMAVAGGSARATGTPGCTNPAGCAYYADNEAELNAALADIFSQIGQPVASAGAVATVSQEIHMGDIVIRGAFRAYDEKDPNTYLWQGHMESYWPYSGCGVKSNETDCKAIAGCKWNSGTSTCAGNIYSFQIPDNWGVFCPDIPSNGNCWDAGKVLKTRGPVGRQLFTYVETNTPRKTAFDTGLANSLIANQLDMNGDSTVNSTDKDLLIEWVYGQNATNARNRHGWILGDIVYSTPVVVGQPSLASVPRRMADADCLGSCPNDKCFYCYKDALKHRDQMVYVGANDGMLHSFTLGKWSEAAQRWIFNPSDNATLGAQLGAEQWGYIPGNLLTELQTLAQGYYGTTSGVQHRYMVDLSPQAWDMKIDHDNDGNATWRTVVLGGERGGGDVYFALDVTDPASPNILWEYSLLKDHPAPASISAGFTSHYNSLKKLPMAWSLPYAGHLLAPSHSNPNPYVAFAGGGVRDFRPDLADANATIKLKDLDGYQYLYYPTFHAIDIKTGGDLWHNAWATLLASPQYRAYFPLPGELIKNGGFEGSPNWSNWTQTPGNGSITLETSLIHHGAQAAKLTRNSNACYISQNITVQPGKTYQLDFWTRGDGTNAGQYQIRNVTAGTDIVVLTPTSVTGTAYQKVTKAFTAPTGCVTVEIRLQSPAANNGTAYFDDVSVTANPYVLLPYAVSNLAAFDVYDAAGYSITSGSAPDGYTDLLYGGDYNGTLYSLPINASNEQSVLPSCVIMRKTKANTDINLNPPNYNPFRGSRQPITVTPVAALDSSSGNGNLRVFFGTGKFDDVVSGENSDKTDNATMTFYCLVESLNSRIGCGGNMTTIVSATANSPKVAEKCRASSGHHHWVKQQLVHVLVNGHNVTQNATFADGDACFECMYDFERPGERMLDSALVAGGYVFFTTFIPNEDSCSAGGTAYLYVLDYMCRPIKSSPIVSGGGVQYRDVSTGSWSDTEPAKIGVVRVDLGTGMPSRPVMDSSGESILIQTSDARLLKIDVDLHKTNKAKIKGWTREND